MKTVLIMADHRVAIHTGKLGILEVKALNTSSVAILQYNMHATTNADH